MHDKARLPPDHHMITLTRLIYIELPISSVVLLINYEQMAAE